MLFASVNQLAMLKDYSLHNLSVIASRVSRDYREDGEKEDEGDDHLADCNSDLVVVWDSPGRWEATGHVI